MNNKLVIARYLLWLLIIISGLIVIYSVIQIVHADKINNYIEHPEQQKIVPEDLRAQFAYGLALENNKKYDKARQVWTEIIEDKAQKFTPLAYVNRGNIQLRKAQNNAAKNQLVALVELAKRDYRHALALKPNLWAARYNLEVALSLVSEDPKKQTENTRNVVDSRKDIKSKAFVVDLP